MPYQVGNSCYATLEHAAVAACAEFVPSRTVTSSGDLIHNFCYRPSVSSAGDLNVYMQTYRNGVLAENISIDPFFNYYRPCTQTDYVDAAISIGVALLTLWASVHALWWLYKKFDGYLTWGRGSE